MTGVVNDIYSPPADTALIISPSEGVVGRMNVRRGDRLEFRRSKPWLDWFNSLVALGQQITVSGNLDFANTPAQTSSDLSIAFVIGGVNALQNSFLIPHWPIPPVNTTFMCWMDADNRIGVRFSNYSAGAINPGSLAFEFLVILKK